MNQQFYEQEKSQLKVLGKHPTPKLVAAVIKPKEFPQVIFHSKQMKPNDRKGPF